MNRSVITRAAVVVAGIAMLAACSSSKSSTGTGASTSAPSTTATPADTTPTTIAPTTVPPTTAPAPIVFTLRGDGIGPLDFGIGITEVLDTLTAEFGPASSDVTTEYPDDDGFGGFQTPDGEIGYVAHFGREVCWSFQFCAEFAGDASADALSGWTYGELAGGTLSSTSGVTIGSRWSDHPAIVVDAGGCYTSGSGEIDGIELTLLSDVVPFATFDDVGNYIEAVPPADQVSVVYMQAGSLPSFLFGDC